MIYKQKDKIYHLIIFLFNRIYIPINYIILTNSPTLILITFTYNK
jgi:hypothetical protein